VRGAERRSGNSGIGGVQLRLSSHIAAHRCRHQAQMAMVALKSRFLRMRAARADGIRGGVMKARLT